MMAQLVEQRIRNAWVAQACEAGSTPVSRSIHKGDSRPPRREDLLGDNVKSGKASESLILTGLFLYEMD